MAEKTGWEKDQDDNNRRQGLFDKGAEDKRMGRLSQNPAPLGSTDRKPYDDGYGS